VSDDGGGASLECAEAAAEALRALSHASGTDTGVLAGPVEVHAVLGALARLAARLPQALVQLLDLVAAEHTAGTLQVVNGLHVGAPAAAVTDLARHLCWAATSAQALHTALEQAQATLTWAASAHPD
jgi:hypothetical protein